MEMAAHALNCVFTTSFCNLQTNILQVCKNVAKKAASQEHWVNMHAPRYLNQSGVGEDTLT